MSAPKILIEQAKPIEGRELVVANADWFIFTMSRAFGAFPVELDNHHLKTLEGMSACWQGPGILNPYDVLIRQVKRLGTVRVWQAYEADGAEPVKDDDIGETDPDQNGRKTV